MQLFEKLCYLSYVPCDSQAASASTEKKPPAKTPCSVKQILQIIQSSEN